MIGFTAYQKYLAIRMHFNPKTDYDYFKYNGKTSAKPENFAQNKKNLYKYGGIEKRVGVDELETFFFINIKDEPFKPFVPQLWYKYYKSKMSRFYQYIEENEFDTDIGFISNLMRTHGLQYEDLFKQSKNHLHPMLYVWYDKGIISEYTYYFIDLYIRHFINEESSSDPLLWKEVVEQHMLRKHFYKRCYFSRLYSTEEMIKNWTKAFKDNLGTQ